MANSCSDYNTAFNDALAKANELAAALAPLEARYVATAKALSGATAALAKKKTEITEDNFNLHKLEAQNKQFNTELSYWSKIVEQDSILNPIKLIADKIKLAEILEAANKNFDELYFAKNKIEDDTKDLGSLQAEYKLIFDLLPSMVDKLRKGRAEIYTERLIAREIAQASADAWSKTQDPLLLDLTGHGIATTSLAGSTTHFAYDASHPAIHTGWMATGTGMLVQLDARGTPSPFQDTAAFADGFAALGMLDANHDGVIDAADPAFAALRVWIDANGSGVADAGELKTLAELHIASINLTTTASSLRDHGNFITRIGSYTLDDGTKRQIADVNFVTDPTDTAAAPPVSSIVDFTADGAAHQYVAGDGDTIVRMGSGGGNVRLGAGHATVFGGGGKETVTFGSGLGTVTGGEGGLNTFIFVKGQITDAIGDQVDTVTDFHGAGKAWTADHDFIWLKGFGAGATITLDHDIAEGRHLYRITDGTYAASIELDYAGTGVQLNHGQWNVMA